MSTRHTTHEPPETPPDVPSGTPPEASSGVPQNATADAAARRAANAVDLSSGSELGSPLGTSTQTGPAAQNPSSSRGTPPPADWPVTAHRPTAPTVQSRVTPASQPTHGDPSNKTSANMERYTLIDASTLPVVVPAAVTGELPRIEPHEQQPAKTDQERRESTPAESAAPSTNAAPSDGAVPANKSPFHPLLAQGTSVRPQNQPTQEQAPPPVGPPVIRESRRPGADGGAQSHNADRPVARHVVDVAAVERNSQVETELPGAANSAGPANSDRIGNSVPAPFEAASSLSPNADGTPGPSRRQRRERRPLDGTPEADPSASAQSLGQPAVTTSVVSIPSTISNTPAQTAANPTAIPGLDAPATSQASAATHVAAPSAGAAATPSATSPAVSGSRPAQESRPAPDSRPQTVSQVEQQTAQPAEAQEVRDVMKSTGPLQSPEVAPAQAAAQSAPGVVAPTATASAVAATDAPAATSATSAGPEGEANSAQSSPQSAVAAAATAPPTRSRARSGGGWRPSATRGEATQATPITTTPPRPVEQTPDVASSPTPDTTKNTKKKTKRGASDGGRAVRIKGGSLGPQKQTRPVLIGVAIATILGSAAVFGSLYLNAGDRMEVLVAAGDIQPGEQVTLTQLKVGLAAGEDFSAIKAADRSQYVGKIARGFIPKGSVVTSSHFAEQSGMQPGTVATPLELAQGRVPHGLTQGRELTVWSVDSGPQGDDATKGSTRLVERALVTHVNTSPNGGVILTIITTEAEAQQLASLAARKSVAVSLLPARSPEKP